MPYIGSLPSGMRYLADTAVSGPFGKFRGSTMLPKFFAVAVRPF